jgi:uncharacterized protein YndB with AHSA1/START domain
MKKVVTAVVFSTFAVALLDAADFKKTSLITIPKTIELKAAPADVWKVLTTWEGFGALTGFRPTDAQKSFSKVGESVTAQVWDDTGTLVVTGLVPQKELRVSWEPDNASYLCAKRILVKPSAAGTTLEYWDRYTDDQPDAEQTAKKVVTQTAQHVAAFRKMVEK